MLFFLSPQYCCFWSLEFNNTSLPKWGGGNTATRTSTFLSFKLVVETRNHYHGMLQKSFIWLTRVWFHHMFRSKVKCLMMMMNCFCGMVDWRKAFGLISSRDHCQRSSPSRISSTPRAGFEPAQNLSSGLVEWSCAVVITTTPQRF